MEPELLVGPNHKVADIVKNDGYLNHYVVESKWGELKVPSTPLLRKRILEFNSIAEMKKLKGSKEFKSGVKNAGKRVVSGGKEVVTHPRRAVKNVGKGIGGIFSSIGHAVKRDGDPHGDTEGSAVQRLSGFSKAKRQYAKRFEVDPYSRNQYLQDELADISKAGYWGGTATSVGLGAVGGLAVTVASRAEFFKELIYSNSPGNLRKYNRKKLKKMGVSKDVVDLFIRNKNYTITGQTALVTALDSMRKTKNKKDFVKFAVLPDSPELARFRTLQAQLYSGYHQNQQTIKKFEHFGEYSCARTKDRSLLVAAPVDRLLWTPTLSQYIKTLDQAIEAIDPSSKKLLWVTGTVSPLASKKIKELGWNIETNTLQRMKAGAKS